MLKDAQLAFLRALLEAPSPPGAEGPARKVYADYCRQAGAEVRIDRHGNAIASAGRGGPRIMLAGHMDEIALMVRHIDDQGFLYLTNAGGFDVATLLGNRVVVQTKDGPVKGVVGRTPTHTLKAEERKKAPELKDVWVDIGVRDGKAARALVATGDFVIRDTGFNLLQGDMAVARAFDDKVGVLVAAEAVAHAARKRLKATVVGVATVQEEIGIYGAGTAAFGVDPDVAIAVDVTYTSDHPGVRKEELGDVRSGAGPVLTRGPQVHPRLFQLLEEVARKLRIPVQVDTSGEETQTDLDSIFRARAGVPTCLVSIATRYLHTGSEVASLRDVAQTVQLVNGAVEALSRQGLEALAFSE